MRNPILRDAVEKMVLGMDKGVPQLVFEGIERTVFVVLGPQSAQILKDCVVTREENWYLPQETVVNTWNRMEARSR